MAIEGQSTDRIPIDTNPYTSRVLLRGSVDITTSAPGGGVQYYYGAATIDLSAYDFSTIVPEAEVYFEITTGDLSTGYQKAPCVLPSIELTADGKMALTDIVNYSLQRGSVKTAEIHGNSYTLRLVINYYTNTDNVTGTFHYQIKSTEAAPFT